MVPDVDEQKQISQFLASVDETISLRERELEKLKQLKAACLDKMFANGGGKSRPSIRFAGFTDEWQSITLGEITNRVTRKNSNLECQLPLTISATYGLISQADFYNARIASADLSGYYLLYNGEFAYNKSTSSDYPWGAIKRLDNYDKGVISTLYIAFVPKEDVDSNYIVSYYETDKWYDEIKMRAAEGARNHGLLNIAPVDFFDTEILILVLFPLHLHLKNLLYLVEIFLNI
jgi:type I restriction enzyme S subunit